jgi:hypothetical protein
MFELLVQVRSPTGDQVKMVAVAVIGDMLECFDGIRELAVGMRQ